MTARDPGAVGAFRALHFPDATPEMLTTLEEERDRMTARIRCLTRNRDAITEYLEAVRAGARAGTAPRPAAAEG